jgi:beta-phosphoglucomutase
MTGEKNATLRKFHGLEVASDSAGLQVLDRTADGRFVLGHGGVELMAKTGDHKVEFIGWATHTLAHVRSEMGYPAYYPVEPVETRDPLRAVLMDLDGTTIRSEEFWIWIIEQATSSLRGDPKFSLEDSDIPFVSGHSVSEHLSYCIRKYCPGKSLQEARGYYFEHTHREMEAIMQGRGRPNAFTPCEGIKEFLLELKGAGVRIGLVTSGLYEKAWPEILDGFKTLGMGAPEAFYDTIITAGFPLRQGVAGTLGELSPKPHPWLYAEACRVGLGIDFQQRHQVVAVEDSAAGVCAARIAGFATYGVTGGNIIEGGAQALCHRYVDGFEPLIQDLRGRLPLV